MPASFRNHILQHTGEDTPHTVSAKIKMTNITRLEEEKHHYISNAGSFLYFHILAEKPTWSLQWLAVLGTCQLVIVT